jgi:DNA-directed RNA polymerase beta' subunit
MEDLETLVSVPNCNVKIGKESITMTPKASTSDLRKLLDKYSSLQVSGVSGIHRVIVTEEKNEWLLKTDGSNLPKVLIIPGVDPTRTVTNDIHEIADTLGIEAARSAIISEAVGVLEEQGLDVDLRHIMLVADIMTCTGEVHQIGRHGVSGEKSSVLARAAFEITMPTIVDAATKGASDRLNGVTESVIVGQNVPVGTGLIELYMGGTTSDNAKRSIQASSDENEVTTI